MTSHQLSASPSVTYVLNLLCYLCIEPVPLQTLSLETKPERRTVKGCHGFQAGTIFAASSFRSFVNSGNPCTRAVETIILSAGSR